jgi:hypothetical protein
MIVVRKYSAKTMHGCTIAKNLDKHNRQKRGRSNAVPRHAANCLPTVIQMVRDIEISQIST